MAQNKKIKVKNQRLHNALFGMIALAVACASIYGVKSYLNHRNARAEAVEEAAIAEASGSFVDISSPQCNRLEAIARRDFGIVGLNGTYMAFGTNDCLFKQLAKFNHYDLYAGANYPSRHCPNGETPYYCGARAAKFDKQIIEFNNLKPGAIWIDVESGSGIPWGSQSQNRDFLRGMRDVFRGSGYTVGFYSNQSMWNSITGGWNHESWSWYATGRNSASAARAYCNTRFGGGKNLYVQYVDPTRDIDRNVSC